jgi:hypothetical protein
MGHYFSGRPSLADTGQLDILGHGARREIATADHDDGRMLGVRIAAGKTSKTELPDRVTMGQSGT